MLEIPRSMWRLLSLPRGISDIFISNSIIADLYSHDRGIGHTSAVA